MRRGLHEAVPARIQAVDLHAAGRLVDLRAHVALDGDVHLAAGPAAVVHRLDAGVRQAHDRLVDPALRHGPCLGVADSLGGHGVPRLLRLARERDVLPLDHLPYHDGGLLGHHPGAPRGALGRGVPEGGYGLGVALVGCEERPPHLCHDRLGDLRAVLHEQRVHALPVGGRQRAKGAARRRVDHAGHEVVDEGGREAGHERLLRAARDLRGQLLDVALAEHPTPAPAWPRSRRRAAAWRLPPW